MGSGAVTGAAPTCAGARIFTLLPANPHTLAQITSLPLLDPFESRLDLLTEQLAACLEAMSGMVRADPPERCVRRGAGGHGAGCCAWPVPSRSLCRSLPPPIPAATTPPILRSVVELVQSLEEHVQRLFLSVLASDPPPGLSPADVINGLAVVAVCSNAAYVMRLLAIALVRAFRPTGAASADALLQAPTRWAVDDHALQLVTGLLGMAIGTSAAGSGGMSALATPRAAAAAWSPRGGLTPLRQQHRGGG